MIRFFQLSKLSWCSLPFPGLLILPATSVELKSQPANSKDEITKYTVNKCLDFRSSTDKSQPSFKEFQNLSVLFRDPQMKRYVRRHF